MNKLSKFNTFRAFCLKNAEDALTSAENLQQNSVNHIVYHLATLALEEIGKIFLGWSHFTKDENDNSKLSLAIDDHVKKLFWAIWGPFFTTQKITQNLLDEIKNLASTIHNRRLQSLYTEYADELNCSNKIPDEEVSILLNFVRSRYAEAKENGEVSTDISPQDNIEINLFMSMTDNPRKKSFIFSETAQDKLIEFGDIKFWIKWLIETFDKDQEELQKIINDETSRQITFDEASYEPKWKIKFKLISPLYSIRANLLPEFNKKSNMIQLAKGGDNNTLMVELILPSYVSIQKLWQTGWIYSKMFAASINIAARGFFWWNTIRDTERYYDKIYDISNKKEVSAGLITKLNWPKINAVLNDQQLQLTQLVYNYLINIYRTKSFKPIDKYLLGLAMIAKNDIHLRLEFEAFNILFESFYDSLQLNNPAAENIKEFGYQEIGGLIKEQDTYYKIMDLGISIMAGSHIMEDPISLTEVLSIKTYCDCYFLTLAVRANSKNDSILLTDMEESSPD